MNVPLSQQEKIFHEAVALVDAVQRHKFLDAACVGNPPLRAVVEKLLAAHDANGKFFDKRESALSWYEKEVQFTASNLALHSANLPCEEQLGSYIGHYKLIRKIGEGGCGAVYLAEQEVPVRRSVALKVIKLGMDTKNVIARFAIEQQALASMDHPHIASVFDAGATATGRPYFVMELVRGIKITEFCDQHLLNTEQRLNLFQQVCHAIQHAHQKGIIHRDIKPSNILVAMQDGVPVLKVIDFGIAKVTRKQFADETVSTALNQVIGTPAYMSPEQADMGGLDIDTRSDIYSLGVLLYELLTGRAPFDGKKLLADGLDEMRRTLREKEPPPPSTMVAALHGTTLKTIAELRQTDPPQLVSLLKRDLDWIVLKTLEKNRQLRYETVNGLAMDIKRFLNDEPVAARPQSQWYRFQKLVKRNKIIFAAGTVVAAALIVGLGTATWMFFREKQARHEAVIAEEQQSVFRQAAEEARHRAEVRETITQTAFAISQDRLEQADKKIQEIAEVPSSLESAAVFRALGEWHALNGRYKTAADRFAVLSQVNQFDNWNGVTADALARATVLVEHKDLAGYETFREELVKQFAATANPIVAERIIKAALLFPAKNSFYKSLEPLAQTALPKIPQTILAAPSPQISSQNGQNYPSPDLDATSESLNNDSPVGVCSICSMDGRGVWVGFRTPVDMVTATNPANYSISGTTVSHVTAGDDGKSVTLWPASELTGAFTVTARRIKTPAPDVVEFSGTMVDSVRSLQLRAMGDAANTGSSATYVGDLSTVLASGSDLYKNGDNFVFQYLTVTNDFDYRLRIISAFPVRSPFTRSGLLVRDSLTNIYGHMFYVCRNFGPNAGNLNADSAQVNVRMAVNGRVDSFPANPLPSFYGSNSWVRLQRSQNIFTSYYSSNGMDWVQLNQFNAANAGDTSFTNRELYLGISTCSHSMNATVTAVTSSFGPTPHASVKITAQPQANIIWRQGAPASIGITAIGSAIAYRWQMNGADIPGATNAQYTLPDARLSDTGIYSVVAYNDINTVHSSKFKVTVLPDTTPPIINSVMTYDGLSVGVVFNKLMDPVTASDAINYQVNSVAVIESKILPDGLSVALRPSSPVNGKFTVTVDNVQDLSGNTITAGSKITGSALGLKASPLGDVASQPFIISYEGNRSTISAGGSGFIAGGDHLLYQYLRVTNDFDYRLRVKSVDTGGARLARVGLMARDSITTNTSHQVMVSVNGDDTFQVLVRTANGGGTQSQPPYPLPMAFGSNSWVRLQRIGTVFYTYGSSDGENWMQLHQFDGMADADGPFANPLYLGVATSASLNKQNVTAEVYDLGLNQTVPASTMVSLALLNYRTGDYDRAMEWCRLCLTSDYQAAHIATAHILLAMCCQKLNRTAEARTELATGRSIINVKFSTGLDHGNATQGFWFDWVSARIMLREVDNAIE